MLGAVRVSGLACASGNRERPNGEPAADAASNVGQADGLPMAHAIIDGWLHGSL
jgi:hypothetical protein